MEIGTTFYTADFYHNEEAAERFRSHVDKVMARTESIRGVRFGPIRRDEEEERKLLDVDPNRGVVRVYAADVIEITGVDHGNR